MLALEPLLDHVERELGLRQGVADGKTRFRPFQGRDPLPVTEYTPEGRLTVRDAAGTPTCQEPSAAAPCRLQPGLPFAFASAWRSAASGLVHLRNRWNSPELGEFLGPATSRTDAGVGPSPTARTEIAFPGRRAVRSGAVEDLDLYLRAGYAHGHALAR